MWHNGESDSKDGGLAAECSDKHAAHVTALHGLGQPYRAARSGEALWSLLKYFGECAATESVRSGIVR